MLLKVSISKKCCSFKRFIHCETAQIMNTNSAC